MQNFSSLIPKVSTYRAALFSPLWNNWTVAACKGKTFVLVVLLDLFALVSEVNAEVKDRVLAAESHEQT